ncbi:hemerythrin domain-containing protein [Actinomadura rugatobispora]|uniref:Hemerythrin domain-containing protein n=1 Tax=Actinomadura rugatobispora TaxID=1994 RepID=A0ABW0ZSC3_9ACTN|nr:hemerythrin domain-containing protein [Actinomadura rugatobispora]
MRPHGEDDIIGVLTHEHREIQTMFDDLQLALGAEEKRRMAGEVTVELVRHAVAEERYLYPAARRIVPDGDAVADREIEDHAEVEKLLRRLAETDVGDPAFDRMVTSLVSDVMAHVQDEEATLFPRLARHADAAELAELGRRVRAARAAAPSRARPAGGPPLSRLLAPGGGLVDRVRDHLAGRI